MPSYNTIKTVYDSPSPPGGQPLPQRIGADVALYQPPPQVTVPDDAIPLLAHQLAAAQ